MILFQFFRGLGIPQQAFYPYSLWYTKDYKDKRNLWYTKDFSILDSQNQFLLKYSYLVYQRL